MSPDILHTTKYSVEIQNKKGVRYPAADRKKKKKSHADSVLPLCCGVGLSLTHHCQRTASRCHFLFDLPRNQVAGFHSQEVDA